MFGRQGFWVMVGCAVLLFGGACTKKNKVAEPDAGAQLDAGPQADASDQVCTPLATTCEAEALSTCASDGKSATSADCPLGCFNATRCRKVAPSNGLADLLDMATQGPDLVFNGVATIDTSAESITDDSGALVLPTSVVAGGPVEVFVIRVNSLTANKIVVTGSRALAIVSNGDIVLNLGLELDADLHNSSPGSVSDTSTCGQRDSSGVSPDWPGAGGGGFGGDGGDGGDVHGLAGGQTGLQNGTVSLVPLRGGCDGGNAATGQGSTLGGRGGGAVQIVSNTSILVPATGYVSANGGGASGGPPAPLFCILGNPCYPGSGGGSGGGILLEAPKVIVASEAGLFANGGSGGCRFPGENGSRGTSRATGGDCSAIEFRGSGGSGGAATDTGGLGGQGLGLTENGSGGGGGGGVGRIRINMAVGDSSSVEGTISPAASFGALGTR